MAQNIQGIFSVGDYTGQDTNQVTHLELAWSDGWQALDALGVPWGVAPGNHDYDANSPSSRLTTAFDSQIGFACISRKPWYGGYWTGDPNDQKANQYIKFTEPTTGRKFLVFFLEFYPRPGVLTWASEIVAANTGREILVITHGYMQADAAGTLIDRTTKYGPDDYGLPSTDASGVDLEAWAAAQGVGVRAVVCGHYINQTSHFNYRSDTASDGHMLFGLFQNWQDFTAPKFVVLLQFSATQVVVTYVDTQTLAFGPSYTLAWTPSSPTGRPHRSRWWPGRRHSAAR